MQLAMEGKSLEEAMIVLAERIDTICNTKEEALRNNFRKSKLFLVQMTYQKAGKVYEKDRPKAPSCNSRTRNDDQLDALQEAGANQVVPESLEGSLMLVSQVLSLTGVPFSRIMRRVQKERKDHYSHLHGFFQGEHTDMSPEAMDRIEFANAIILTENSFAIGHSIASLNLTSKRVTAD